MRRDKMKDRRWCFTLNNYTPEEVVAINAMDCKYMVYGRELSESGTPHLQGYVVFNTQKRLAAMKKLNARCHWEVANGTTEQNYQYCTKQNDYYEQGTKPMNTKEQAKDQKEKWAAMIKAAKEGTCEEEYPREYTMYRYLRDLNPGPKLETLDKIDAYWYYGEPGTGKSKKARQDNPEAYEKLTNKWWDNYNHEEVVIIDDLDKNHIHMGSFLKRYADHYPFRAEFKGGSKMIRPKKIIVTSNYKIDEIWTDDEPMVRALGRRFVEIRFGMMKTHML